VKWVINIINIFFIQDITPYLLIIILEVNSSQFNKTVKVKHEIEDEINAELENVKESKFLRSFRSMNPNLENMMEHYYEGLN